MGGLFSSESKQSGSRTTAKAPANRITDHDRAVLDLKNQRDRIEKYKKQMNGLIELDHKAALKALDNKNKQMAKLLLARKKFRLSLLENTDQQIMNLEEMASRIESAALNQEILRGLESGNMALKKIQQELTVEDAERIMSDHADAKEYMEDLERAMGQNMSSKDMEEIENELAALVAADAAEKLKSFPQVADTPLLPSVPTDEPVSEDVGQTEKSSSTTGRVMLEA